MDDIELEYVKNQCTELLLIPFEGYAVRLPNGDCKAYPDPATGGAPWTIGFGSTYHIDGTPVKKDEVWTREYAIKVKSMVLEGFIKEVIRLCPDIVNESNNKLIALSSLVYNIGIKNFVLSTLRQKINNKKFNECPKEFMKWVYANGKVMEGLKKRRKAEADIFEQA